jgi:hypothetical protein
MPRASKNQGPVQFNPLLEAVGNLLKNVKGLDIRSEDAEDALEELRRQFKDYKSCCCMQPHYIVPESSVMQRPGRKTPRKRTPK